MKLLGLLYYTFISRLTKKLCKSQEIVRSMQMYLVSIFIGPQLSEVQLLHTAVMQIITNLLWIMFTQRQIWNFVQVSNLFCRTNLSFSSLVLIFIHGNILAEFHEIYPNVSFCFGPWCLCSLQFNTQGNMAPAVTNHDHLRVFKCPKRSRQPEFEDSCVRP